MSWIQPISPDAAEGATKEIIDDLRKTRKPIPRMFLEMGWRPDILAGAKRSAAPFMAARASARGGRSCSLSMWRHTEDDMAER